MKSFWPIEDRFGGSMNEVTQAIADFIFRETGLSSEEGQRIVEVPRDPRLGDYAFPCFNLAKVKGQPPKTLAREMALKFQPGGLLSHCTSAGAYLNFRIQGQPGLKGS